MADKKTLNEIKEEIENLSSRLEKQVADGDETAATKTEKEIAKHLKYLGGAMKLRKQPRDFNDLKKRTTGAVQTAIRRAISSINVGKNTPKAAQILWGHLHSSIKRSSEFAYNPSSNETWDVDLK
jgi:hypothetical protein